MPLEGHHHDYKKKLEVEWLCHCCHMARHVEQRLPFDDIPGEDGFVVVQTSLSPSQAAWVASRGVPVAAYLRGLVERDQAIGDVVHGQHQGSDAMFQPGRRPAGRWAHLAQSGWILRRPDLVIVGMHLTEAQAIDWCLTGTLPDLVKIGGDV